MNKPIASDNKMAVRPIVVPQPQILLYSESKLEAQSKQLMDNTPHYLFDNDYIWDAMKL